MRQERDSHQYWHWVERRIQCKQEESVDSYFLSFCSTVKLSLIELESAIDFAKSSLEVSANVAFEKNTINIVIRILFIIILSLVTFVMDYPIT